MNKVRRGKDPSRRDPEQVKVGRKIFVVGMQTVRRLQEPYYQGKAAEIGFYFIFTVVPVITLLLQVINQLPPARARFDNVMEAFGDDSVVNDIFTALQSAHSGGISVIFLLVALVSASKLEFSMIRMSNYTYSCPGENGFIGYFKARFRAIFTLIMLIILIMTSLLALVYGNMLIDLANDVLSTSAQIDSRMMTSVLRWPLMLFVYWLFLAVNYMVSPNETLHIREVLPGSLFAAIGILVATIAYYLYFKFFSHLNVVYGSLTAIIALLLWFYWLGFILVIGMVVNASWFGRGDHSY